MLQEFKEFALKGNAITLAVGVVMGAAFNAIISAIVAGLFTPIIGVLIGGVDLVNATFSVGGAVFGWGAVIDAFLKFIFTAIALFIVVKFVAKFQKEEEEADPSIRPCPFCLTEIPTAASRCPACTSEVTPA